MGFLPQGRVQDLLEALARGGRRVLGPRLRDGVLAWEPLEEAGQLPWGLRVEQGPGRWRTRRSEEGLAFAWSVGPQGLKPLLFPPEEPLWRLRRGADGALAYEAGAAEAPPTAVLGVRGCDLAALALLDAHFLRPEAPDPGYAARRRGLFLVAVHCTHPAEVCFCASTGDGPAAGEGCDLALGELPEGFLVEAASPAGEALARELDLEPADGERVAWLRGAVAAAARGQQRRLPRELAGRLLARAEHPRWDEVAERCLACAGCTAVCPTCFCASHHERPGLEGESVRWRRWSSCFTEGHSYLHGIVLRAEARDRYRQWLTHKLDAWHRQYGRSGCVGCGRCITWCPAGIDLTEEAGALLQGPEAGGG
ncbi:MAG: sulfite reductase subunit A [Gammaproteobacteria bacterium]|nr:MAG: sulfite reductase subunit A [Gammaproteobacteria bacterium]